MATLAHTARPIFEALSASRWFDRAGAALVALALMAGAYAIALAQVGGDRGITPTATSADIQIRGIEIDVTGSSPQEARREGWELAQRLAWEKAGGPKISDNELAGLVSSIVIQREQLGPRRYIATLGVIFDRKRAGRYLGDTARARPSAPMLIIPVSVSAGAYTAFEVRNPWQRAWAEFNPGTSRIDYVRPSGAGGDSLLLNFGQTGRRSRTWWRSTLDQYNAADVLIPTVRLEHQFPGGPIRGVFTARYGPDSRVLASFTLKADEPGALPDMLNEAVERMDRAFEQALVEGKLQPDPTLRVGGSGEVDPALQRLIEIGKAVRAREAAELEAAEAEDPAAGEGPEIDAQATVNTPEQTVPVAYITVQFETPDALSFDAALSGVRGTAGVRALSVTSTAIGGTSMMSVGYAGTGAQLAQALRSRGFSVTQRGAALTISR